MTGTRTHFDALIGPGNPVHNITTSAIKCIPTGADAKTVTSGSSQYGFGSWVEFIAADAVSADFVPIGISVRADGVNQNFGGSLQIGYGSTGNEVSIYQMYMPYLSAITWKVFTRTLFLSKKISAKSRVAIRVKDYSSNASDYKIKLVYCQNMRMGGFLSEDSLDLNSSLAYSNVTAGANWSFPVWRQIITSTTIGEDTYLRSICCKNTGHRFGEVRVGIGELGQESVIATVPVEVATIDMFSSFDLPIFYKIPAYTRISVSACNGGGSSQAWQIGVDLTKGLLIN